MSKTLSGLLAEFNSKNESCPNLAAIALGSNLGDRFANIEQALRLLEDASMILRVSEESAQVHVVDTSFMYETAPMYVTDQPSFINCACMIETTLPTFQLLLLLKEIEITVGRVPSIRNGPRAVDLDIITFNTHSTDTRKPEDRANLDNLHGHLVVPHPRMHEREFVLRPLADMIPDFTPPLLNKTIRELLDALTPNPDEPPMTKVIPFPQYPSSTDVPSTSTYWTSKDSTRLMATLNTTPDSFSDGSQNNTLPTALAYVKKSLLDGAHIIDIGGYSTRPNAAFVSPHEELSRVVPVIQAIRETNKTVLISVDTFRPTVAKAAVLAGANCINDVCAFTGQDSYPLTKYSAEDALDMRKAARKLSVPVVLMHSRGEASANKDYTGQGGVINAIRTELGDKVDAVVRGRGGIRRWSVIVDPGIGFSKSVEDNLTALRCAGDIVAPGSLLAGYPQLIGTSRKSFIGSILERETEAKARDWATAAAVTCAVQQGAAVVRVHNVAAMADVVRVADVLWSK